MPDPIKDLYNSVKTGGLFIDENDFRTQLTKSPKEIFPVVSSLFIDYNDFENQVGLKKKDGGITSPVSPLPSRSKNLLAQVPDELPLGIPQPQSADYIHSNEVAKAKAKVDSILKGSDDIYQRVIKEDRLNQFDTQLRSTPTLDGFVNPAAQTAKRDIVKVIPVTQEEVAKKKEQVFQDPTASKDILRRSAKKDPEVAKSAYLIDSEERIANDPSRVGTVIGNANKIASGELTYDIKSGRLQKPEGVLMSTYRGFQERNRQMDDYKFFTETLNEDAIISQLNADMKDYDPERPMPVPDGGWAGFGQSVGMESIAMAKGAGAATITAAIPGAQGLAPYVAAFAASPEYYKRGYSSALRQAYYEQVQKGVPETEALKVARKQAETEANLSAAEGFASGLVGARIGLKPTTLKLGGGFKNAVNNTMVSVSNFAKENLADGALDGTVAGGLQIAKNIEAINNGLDRKVFDGVQENVAGELEFAFGLGLLTKAGKFAINPKSLNTIVTGIAQQPKEVVDAKLGEMVVSGKATPNEVIAAGKTIEEARTLNAQIPQEITDEESRAEIADRIKTRQALKNELATANEVFHEDIKNKIKAVDEEIVGIVNVQRTSTSQGVSQPQVTVQEQSTQPQTEVSNSIVNSEGQLISPELSNIETLSPYQIEVSNDATEFANQMTAAQSSLGKAGMSVSPYPQEDYDDIASKGGQFLRAAGNKILALLKPNGEMVSLVKDATVKTKGAAQAMISKMKDMGGLFMDNYDIYLTPIYEKAGYKVVARVPFNEEYAPEGWNAEDSPLKNKPDVVFMVRNDLAPDQAQTFQDYGDAQAFTQGLVDKAVGDGTAKLPTQISTDNIANELLGELGSPIDTALEAAIPNATKSLEKANIKFQVVDGATNTDFAKAARGNQGLFVAEDGTIFIDKSKLQDELEAGLVVWHEASHPVMNIIRNTNKPLYDAVVRGLNEAAKKNAGIAGALNWAKSQKEYKTEDVQNDEAIVETIGRINSGLIDVSTLDTGLRQQIIDFVNSIAKFFGIDPILNDTDIAAFKKTVSEVADALMTGRDISEIVGAENIERTDSSLGVQKRSINEMLSNDVEKKVVSGSKVSTRTPSAKGAPDDVHSTDKYVVDLKSQRSNPTNYINNAVEVSSYPLITGIKKSDIATLNRGLLPKSKGGTEEYVKSAMKVADKIYDKFVRAVADNLIWLHNHFNDDLRAISRRWYDGANKIAQDYGAKFDVSLEQASGVMAVLSPQMDWYKNVSLAERVLDIVKNKRDFVFDDKMADTYVRISANLQQFKNESDSDFELRKIAAVDNARKDVQSLVGKRLDSDPSLFAKTLRTYDETYNEKSYDILSPNAEVIGKAKNKDGSLSSIGWQGYGTIAKAISIIEEGTSENISRQLGDMHKVRNFYNNIADPNSANGDVTIDTHAVAAGLLKPLAGSDSEVIANLSGKGSAITGSTGTYPAFADAYRLAAKEAGIEPRQMQSITWEAVRGLFKDTWKSDKRNKAKINDLWDAYSQGKTSIDETRKLIDIAAGGVETPSWARSSSETTSENGTTPDTGELSRASDMGRDRGARRGVAGESETDMVQPASQASVGNRDIFNKELPDNIINSVRASLRKKAPDSTTLQYLDELQQAKKDDNLLFEGPVNDMLENGVTLNDIASMLLDDEVFEDVRQVRNYFNNIGGPDGVGILTKASQASVGNRGEMINWEKLKPGKGDPKISSRNPIVTQAAADLKAGKITNEEYRAVASENNPIRPITRFFEPATKSEVYNALSSDKIDKIDTPIQDGSPVGIRLDIPAFKNNNTWVVSVHEGNTNAGKSISYSNVARITDVNFGLEPKAGLKIAAGESKSTIGRIFGKWQNLDGENMKDKGENAKQIIQDTVGNPDWVQVGFNPFRHSYFYDRSSDMGRPIASADEVVQIGGLVYAKKPVYGNWTDESYRVKGLFDKAGAPVQFSVGNRPESSVPFKVASFVMRKLGEGANKSEIAQGVMSATGMSAEEVQKVMADPEQYIRDSFPELSNIAKENLVERAKVQNIYRGRQFGMPINKAFVGAEVPRSKVVEYLNKTKMADKTFMDSVKDFKNKWLTASKGLPDWLMAVKDFAVGRKNIEIARAIKTIEQLKEEAKKIGFTDWDAFSKAMVAASEVKRFIPDEDGLVMFDPVRASEGKMFTTPDDMLPAVIPDAIKALPESIRPFAVKMRQQIDGLTKDLIGSGYVTPEQAVTLEKNIGQYVNRAYKMFNERGFKPNPDQVVDAIKFIADQKFKQILSELFPAGKPSKSKEVSDFKGNVIDADSVNIDELYNQAVEEAKKDVQAIVDKKRNPYFNTKTDSRDTGILKEKKDIPEPIRKLMGEYTDPGTVFVMTVAKQAALASQSEYLNKLRDFGMGSIFYEKNDKNRPAEFSVEVAPTGSETKNPLGGLYTTPEIAEALEMADPSYNELTNMWMKLVGAVRWGKTVGSVATQAKNFESNIGFAVLNGMFLTGDNTQALKAASKYVKGQYSKAEMDAITEKAVKLNLVGQSVGARELSSMLGSGDIHDIALEIAANPNNAWGKKVKKKINVFGAANKLYRMGDEFWKVYAYINERETVARGRYKTSYESLSKEDQDKVDIESSERVKNTWPTYDRVVEAAKYVSKRAPIFGNFISFQAESLRVLANSIKMAREDMKDPQMKAAGIKRAVGIMTYIGLRTAITYGAAQAAGMATSGILGAAFGDDDEEQKKRAFKKAMPIYARTADIAVVPTDAPHKFTAFSLSSLDPYGIVPNSLNAFTEGREGIFSKEMQPGVKAATAEFFSGFLEPEMTFSTMYSVMNNINPKTGRPIVLDSDTDAEVAAKVASFVMGQLEPSTLSMIDRGMERGWTPELASFAGARPIDIDLHKSFGFAMTDMGKQMDAIKAQYNSVKYNDKSTEAEKAEAELEAERKKAFLISKVAETYRDFIKVGASPKVLDEMINERSSIKTTGFDKATKRGIKTGEVKSEKLFK